MPNLKFCFEYRRLYLNHLYTRARARARVCVCVCVKLYIYIYDCRNQRNYYGYLLKIYYDIFFYFTHARVRARARAHTHTHTHTQSHTRMYINGLNTIFDIQNRILN